MDEDDFFQIRFRSLLHRQSSYIPSSNSTNMFEPPPQHIRFRYKVLVWVYNIVGHYLQDREVVTIVMDYIDRFVLLHPNPDNICARKYQLVAMSSLYIAMKLRAGEASFIAMDGTIQAKKNVSIQTYSELSSGQLSPKDITSMELSILSTLNGKLNPVTSMCFVDCLLRLMKPLEKDNNSSPRSSQSKRNPHLKMTLGREVLHELAMYFTELVILLPENSAYFNLDCRQQENNSSLHRETFTPSTVAYVSILLSMEAISVSALPLIVREHFMRKCMQLSNNTDDARNDLNLLLLNPDRNDIKELQLRLKRRFRPDLFLKHFTTTTTQNTYITKRHPIKIAIQQCGILEPRFIIDGFSSSAQ